MNRSLAAAVLVLGSLLAWAVSAYAGASAEARLLDSQLIAANEAVVAKTDSLTSERAASDALLAAQDSAQAADTAAVNEAAAASDASTTDTDQAIAAALVLAAEYPVIRDALILAQTELGEERDARLAERATSAAAVFAGQQRERVLGMQLLNERAASDNVITGLRASLSISMQESDAWQRAAAPGALTQVWRQGRAVLVVAALVLAIK